MTTTRQTITHFIAAHIIIVRFVPVCAKQETESEFKTWQLHYSAVVTCGKNTDTFTYFAGWGCAKANLDLAAKRKLFHDHDTNAVAQGLAAGTDPKRFHNQNCVRTVMNRLLSSFTPKTEDLLGCLKLDAICGDQSFHDFCGDMGYDEDSRSAENTWRACQESGRKLRALLGHAAFAELLETESD